MELSPRPNVRLLNELNFLINPMGVTVHVHSHPSKCSRSVVGTTSSLSRTLVNLQSLLSLLLTKATDFMDFMFPSQNCTPKADADPSVNKESCSLFFFYTHTHQPKYFGGSLPLSNFAHARVLGFVLPISKFQIPAPIRSRRHDTPVSKQKRWL